MARIRSVGIIGYGSFGSFLEQLLKRFAPTVQVRIFSRRKRPDGRTFFSLEETCAADAVVLAVPIREFESFLKQILPLLGPKTVIIDVATVKVHTAELLKKYAQNRPYIASHPMFGPESYRKSAQDVSGFRIVITKHTLDTKTYRAMTAFLKECGFDIVEMSAQKHDKHLAETLFLTHFIGQTVARAGFTRTTIDTVSFHFLMDAVESVRHDTELFKDVFRFNPYCKDVLRRFKSAESDTYAVLRTGKKPRSRK